MPPRLFVLHADAAVRASAMAAHPGAVLCRDWAELAARLSTAAPTAQALVDPCPGEASVLAPELGELLRALPSVSVTAALQMEPARLAHVRTLQAWGICEVAALPAEASAQALQHILARARGRAFLRAVKAVLPPHLSGNSTAVVIFAAQAAHAGGGAGALARTLGQRREMLTRTCADEGLPAPARLMAWMRALVMAQLLDDPARTAAGVARACGYGGVAPLSDAFARVLQGAEP
ncbi:MAG TPA: hypothetical protein VFH27_18500, partial [Longimicrobiaceae bacterium]|nr:hypothetical protein [Longimicrobiaceae bacterium]